MSDRDRLHKAPSFGTPGLGVPATKESSRWHTGGPGHFPSYSSMKLRALGRSGMGELQALTIAVNKLFRTEDEFGRPPPHVITVEDVTRGIVIDPVDQEKIQQLVTNTSAHFDQKSQTQRLFHARGRLTEVLRHSYKHIESDTRMELVRRAVAYWKRNGQTDYGKDPTVRWRKSMRLVIPRQRSALHKALFIGPRGGKWADAKHTIPWGEQHGKKPRRKPSGGAKKLPRKLALESRNIDLHLASLSRKGTSSYTERDAIQMKMRSLYKRRKEIRQQSGARDLSEFEAMVARGALKKKKPTHGEEARRARAKAAEAHPDFHAAIEQGRVQGDLLHHVHTAKTFLAAHRATLPALMNVINEAAPPGARVQSRVKTLESTLGKLVRKTKYADATKLQDATGVRIVCGTIDEVKSTVAKLRAKYRIIEEDDYIDSPAPGDYRSHHLIIEHGGVAKEIQIRTKNQHKMADWTHDIYKPRTPEQAAAVERYKKVLAAYSKQAADHFYSADKGEHPPDPDLPPCTPVVKTTLGCLDA